MERIQQIPVVPAPRTTSAKPDATPPAETDPTTAAPNPERKGDESAVAPDRESLASVVSELRESLARALPRTWEVGIREDKDTGSTVIEIRDAEGEVVKQIPPEKVLNLQRKLDDLAGVVLDETT